MSYARVVPAVPQRLPPTSPALLLPATRPYFIWWLLDMKEGRWPPPQELRGAYGEAE